MRGPRPPAPGVNEEVSECPYGRVPEAEGEAGRLQRARGVVCAGWHHSEASGFRWGLWLSRGGLRRRADCGELAAWFARAGGQFPLGIAAWFAEASGLR